jgi:hypothetical protein
MGFNAKEIYKIHMVQGLPLHTRIIATSFKQNHIYVGYAIIIPIDLIIQCSNGNKQDKKVNSA